MTKQKMILELSKLISSTNDLNTLFRVSCQFFDIQDLEEIAPQKVKPKIDEIKEGLNINLKNLKPELLYKSVFSDSSISDKDHFDFSKVYKIKHENYNKMLIALKFTDSSIEGSRIKELNNFQYSLKKHWDPLLVNAYEIDTFFKRLLLLPEETLEKIYIACWKTTFLLGF